MRFNPPGCKKRIYLDTLRNMAYHLYRAWCENITQTAGEEQIQKKKMFEDKQKKSLADAEKASKRIPAEEILEIFKNMYLNISKQEMTYNPQFHES